MKKLWKLLILAWCITSLLTVWNTTLAAEWDERFDWINSFWENTTTPVGWINTIWTDESETTWSASLLDTIQRAINRVLWMLSFVALILCLWWGFQMLTAAWDDGKVKSWTKILKNAAIWLVVIWLSWLVVSFVFRIINKVSDNS